MHSNDLIDMDIEISEILHDLCFNRHLRYEGLTHNEAMRDYPYYRAMQHLIDGEYRAGDIINAVAWS